MNSANDASTNAGQTASVEAKATGAVDALDMEFENDNDSYEYHPNEELVDFNEEDPIPALKKSTNGKEAVTSEDKEIKKLA
jgi:hypothetical protein